MKKLLIGIVLILASAASVFAQQDILKGSGSFPCAFLMVDASDSKTGKTGLTPTVTIRKRGGSFASPSGAISEIASGWYELAGNATDSNTDGQLLLHATGSGADPTDVMCGTVVEYDPRASTTLQNIVDALLNEATSGHTTAGTVSKAIIDIGSKTTNLPASPASTTNITAGTITTTTNLTNAATAGDLTSTMKTSVRTGSAVIQKSTARTVAFKMVNTLTGAAMTSGSPACTRAIDSTTFSSTTNSPSTVSALGFATLTLSTSDTNATSFIIVRCTLATANDFNNIYFIN